MNHELIPVTHYGLHYNQAGVAYLHQGRSTANFISMKAPSPYEVHTKRNRLCPHLINVSTNVPDRAHWSLFLRMFNDELVQEMLPLPKGRADLVPFLADPNQELLMTLVMLTRMGSPTTPVVLPLHKLTRNIIMEELSLTNVLPLVLTGVQNADQNYINELAAESLGLPRKLILTGDPHMVIRRPMKRIETNLWHMNQVELQSLNMETIGVGVLRRFARGERIDTEFIRERS